METRFSGMKKYGEIMGKYVYAYGSGSSLFITSEDFGPEVDLTATDPNAFMRRTQVPGQTRWEV